MAAFWVQWLRVERLLGAHCCRPLDREHVAWPLAVSALRCDLLHTVSLKPLNDFEV